jgi:hypothetical protein
MSSVRTIAELETQVSEALREADEFLEALEFGHLGRLDLWKDPVDVARELSENFYLPLVRLISLIRESTVLTDVDLKAVQLSVRRIDAALRRRMYEEWAPEVLHDEGVILGVKPGGFSDDRQLSPKEARAEINEAVDQVLRRLAILRAEAEAAGADHTPRLLRAPRHEAGVEPNTAFIIMMIDPAKPELEDVKQAIREEFARFGVRARRSDDIEHSDEITQRILDAIRTSEFLIADLTGERPSVYYEVGYAHAIGKRPILYRRTGTGLHFDLAVHNCPEYKNVTELRERLRNRLTAMTGGGE